MKQTLGGQRLGSGNKMQVDLHGYERSTHDLGFIWRNTMTTGTIVPFLSIPMLPGDTFDIDLDAIVMTHPTIGPLFGSAKLQLDLHLAPVRLYQAQLHNNKLNVGLRMQDIKLPQMRLTAIVTPLPPIPVDGDAPTYDLDNAQINPSCIFKYLGISGVGQNQSPTESEDSRLFNAVGFLTYWDTVKNYYCNKVENIGAVIHTERVALVMTVTDVAIDYVGGGTTSIPQTPAPPASVITDPAADIVITYVGARPIESQIIIQTSIGPLSFEELTIGNVTEDGLTFYAAFDYDKYGIIFLNEWDYQNPYETPMLPPRIVTFPLTNIDDVREEILERATVGNNAVVINDFADEPYRFVLHQIIANPPSNMGNTQEGLALKTYQSDIFNNWLATEWIDGPGGITETTSIDVSSGSFTIDALRLANKVNQLLNRVAVSGGTYQDWQRAVYDHEGFFAPEIPIYQGGLIKEIVFQEVVSNAETQTTNGTQPLGTLAGRGTLSRKHKGGKVIIKANEMSHLIGLVSITPRIDYSQGNQWDVHLQTMDDYHKPGLDGIGFEDDVTERRAWWDTTWNGINDWIQNSAGKQPAWLNYMTNYNKVYGNFAIQSNEMFMTFNRRYEAEVNTGQWRIKDLTTYIDPVIFNHIFAQTSLDAMNYWVQISVDITARRKMSGKLMPSL